MSEVDVVLIDLMVFFGGGTPNVGVVSECCHAPQQNYTVAGHGTDRLMPMTNLIKHNQT